MKPGTIALLAAATLMPLPAKAVPPARWVATWCDSPAYPPSAAEMAKAHLIFRDQTLREIIHTSIGGNRVRVRFSNAFSPEPVHIDAAGLLAPGGTARPLAFAGKPGITIPPNAIVLTDPVSLAVGPDSDLAISLYVSTPTKAGGLHYVASQVSYVVPGDQTAASAWPNSGTRLARWAFLAGVDLEAPPSASTIVALGDSITDGVHSTPNANRRWPNDLLRRLVAAGRTDLAVIDAGISGNRLTQDAALSSGVSALSRFDRDVLAQPGARYVIVLEGINDIGHAAPGSLTAADLIAGLSQLAERAHEMGLKIFGATLTPDGGAGRGYYTPDTERIRTAYNAWIRTSPRLDGVIDFDKATRDPAHPQNFLPAYDSGDHLHPGDAGYQAMADAIDLGLFR